MLQSSCPGRVYGMQYDWNSQFERNGQQHQFVGELGAGELGYPSLVKSHGPARASSAERSEGEADLISDSRLQHGGVVSKAHVMTKLRRELAEVALTDGRVACWNR